MQHTRLLSGLSNLKVGSFRLRIKLHKTPIVGRPIANLSNSWLAPAAEILCSALQPVERSLPCVLAGSAAFLDAVPKHISLSSQIVTVDAVNLYPSIDELDMIRVVSAQIRRFYRHSPRLSDFYVRILEFVVSNQYIRARGSFWQAHGIATGLSPGVFLANIYVADLDSEVRHLPGVLYYGRYVDDTLIILEDLPSVLKVMRAWKPKSIRWEVAHHSSLNSGTTPFLDLQLQNVAGHLEWSLYEKPQNAYLYLPRTSCHPEQCFRSLVHGEFARLRRNSLHESDFNSAFSRFSRRLMARGYSTEEIERSRLHAQRLVERKPF